MMQVKKQVLPMLKMPRSPWRAHSAMYAGPPSSPAPLIVVSAGTAPAAVTAPQCRRLKKSDRFVESTSAAMVGMGAAHVIADRSGERSCVCFGLVPWSAGVGKLITLA